MSHHKNINFFFFFFFLKKKIFKKIGKKEKIRSTLTNTKQEVIYKRTRND
jgi:hypothetical protein